MKLSTWIFYFGLTHVVGSFDTVESPKCVFKCWDNSKYVSNCLDDATCLCDDGEFQSAVLQCLYSQCQTTQFGSALHHTLSACPNAGIDAVDALPPLIRNQRLRKRGTPIIEPAAGPVSAAPANRILGSPVNHVFGSAVNHIVGSTEHPVARRTVSAPGLDKIVTLRPTRTVGRLPTMTDSVSLQPDLVSLQTDLMPTPKDSQPTPTGLVSTTASPILIAPFGTAFSNRSVYWNATGFVGSATVLLPSSKTF